MINTIKLDGRDNYFIDNDTGEIIDRYDSSKNLGLHIKLGDSILIVDRSKIIQGYGGIVSVEYDPYKFIIDDGYYNLLIKAGYIVYQNYDNEKEYNPVKGKVIRDEIVNDIRKILPGLSLKYNSKESTDNFSFKDSESMITIGDESDHFSYIIKFNTVGNIVNKNHGRKENDLTFYPFNKSMDKFGCIYVSVFCQKNHKCKNFADKYELPDLVIKDLVQKLGNKYHYTSLPVKGQIVYCPGL